MTAETALGRRTAAMDASSAILLCKAGLIEPALRTFRVVMSQAAYGEITRPGYPGSEEFSTFRGRDLFEILDPGRGEDDDVSGSGLGPGETESLLLCLSGAADFVILDDRRGAKLCRKKGIPFINALLVPRILNYYGTIDLETSLSKLGELSELGRYSPWVVDYARGCGRRELSRFL